MAVLRSGRSPRWTPDMNEPRGTRPRSRPRSRCRPDAGRQVRIDRFAEGAVFRPRSTDERRLTDRHTPEFQAAPHLLSPPRTSGPSP